MRDHSHTRSINRKTGEVRGPWNKTIGERLKEKGLPPVSVMMTKPKKCSEELFEELTNIGPMEN